MAETFVARREGHGGVDQVVCLKRVLPAFNQDRDFVEQFQREARLAGALRHSNIVGVVDYGEVGGEQFMALELVDGVDLRSLLASLPDKKLDPELAALIALDLSYALEYAHGAQGGIIHRDLTPSNVLLSKHGEIKLADFGVAKALTGATIATATGFIKGKVPYMAPEQMRGGEMDGRVDLFALGVTLFECLAGRRPFVGQHDVEIMMKVIEGKRPRLLEVAPEVPAELAALVERLLSSEPDDRPEDAGEVIDALAPTLKNASRARDRLATLVCEAYGEKPDDAALVDTALAVEGAIPAADAPAPDSEALLPTAVAPAVTETPARPSTRPPSPAAALPVARAASGKSKRTLVGVVVGMTLGGLALAAFAMTTKSGEQEPPAPVAARPGVAPSTEAAPLPVGAELPIEALPPSDEQPSARAPANSMEASQASDEPSTEPSSMGAPATTAAERAGSAEASPDPERTEGAERAEATGTEGAEEPSATMEAAAERARVQVNVVPWGKVWLGRRLLGRAPQTIQLPPGRHRIRAGYDTPIESSTVVIREGQTRRTVTIELPEM